MEVIEEIGLFDAHCHPTDTVTSLASIPNMKARILITMATRSQDQHLVAQTADDFGITKEEIIDKATNWSLQHKVIPAFGWHPWFSYQMFFATDYAGAENLTPEQKIEHYREVLSPAPDNDEFLKTLPDPNPFEQFLAHTATYLKQYPLALIGEVGLDKAFRIPEQWMPDQRDESLTPGGREGRKLSSYRVSMNHQRKVLQAQLRLAGEFERAASVHGVQAHGVVHDTLSELWRGHEKRIVSKREQKRSALAGLRDGGLEDDEDIVLNPVKPFPPRICLHSFSGPAETVKQYLHPAIPCEIFFSFSTTINAWSEGGDGKVEAAVRAVPDDRLLMESDLHTAGDMMDKYLEEVALKLCKIKGWTISYGIQQLARNWKHFVLGSVEVNQD